MSKTKAWSQELNERLLELEADLSGGPAAQQEVGVQLGVALTKALNGAIEANEDVLLGEAIEMVTDAVVDDSWIKTMIAVPTTGETVISFALDRIRAEVQFRL